MRFGHQVLATCLGALLAMAQPALAAPSFEKDIFPILRENCAGCHSQAEKKAKGGLSLDTREQMLKGGKEGAFYIPGKPEESQLVEMISGPEPEMPKKQPPLPPAQVKLIHDWVAAGAVIDAWPAVVDRKVVIPAVYRFAPAISSLSFSPDGLMLAAACRSEVVMVSLNEDSEHPVTRRLPTDCELLNHVEFSPDGKLLAVAGGSPSRFGEVCFFDPVTGKLITSRRVTHDTLFHGNFSPDGKTLAVGGADGAVHFVPVNSDAAEKSAELHSDWVLSVAYSPNGKWIVTGSRDKATKVAAADTGVLLTALDMSLDMVTAVASDDQFAISVSRRGDLLGFDYKIALSGVEVNGSGNGAVPVNKRSQYTKSFESQSGDVLDLAVSGDRKLLAVSAGTAEVRIYKITDRTRLTAVTNVPGPIYSLALDAKGTKLAVGTKLGRVLIYNLPSGKLATSLTPVPVKEASH
jgi:WD40 repeat protein